MYSEQYKGFKVEAINNVSNWSVESVNGTYGILKIDGKETVGYCVRIELKELEEAEKDSFIVESDLESEILKAKNQEQTDTTLTDELSDEDSDELEESPLDDFEEEIDDIDDELTVLEGEDN